MNVEELLKKQTNKRKEEATVKTKVDEGITLDDAGKQQVQDLIENNQVVVFSKSYCPYCRQAKMTFNSIDNPKLESYQVVEMDDGNHDGWQAYVAELAKAKAIECAKNNNTKSVPQIFINQKYVGGAEDLADLYVDKSLAGMLGRAI